MLRCISIGSKQQAHHQDLLWNMPVPRLDPHLEQEIHALVESGAKKMDEAMKLEEEAWSIVETWITETAI